MKTRTWPGWLLLAVAPPAWCQVSLIQAIETTLARHPQLGIQRERALVARSLIKQAAGQFDTQLAVDVDHSWTHTPLTGLQQLQVTTDGLGVSNMTTNATGTSGGVSRLLSSGVQLSTSANLTRNTDNVVDTHGVNLSTLRFQVNIPFLRGRGRNVAMAELDASRIDSDASVYDLNHTASSLISDTVMQYWQVVAARQAVKVYAEAEERGRVLADNVRTLIEADKLPRAELQQVLANLANRTSARSAAEQRLVEATQALALAMGLPAGEMMTALNPSDVLPDGQTAPLPSMLPAAVAVWLRRSLARRADYLALQQRQAAFSVRRDAAADRLKPQLDFHVATGYSGLKEGRRPDQFLFSPFANVGGADVIAGFTYSLPVGRRTAESQLEQANSAIRQNRLNTEDLARGITASVLAGIGAYQSAIIRTQQARIAVDVSQAALDGEREKLRLGAGSVVDVVTLEDRLTTALGALVDAGLNFAVLIARVRFATGTILEPDRMAQTVDRSIFYRPPWEDPVQ